MWFVILLLLVGMQYLLHNKFSNWKVKYIPSVILGVGGLTFIGLSLRKPEGWTWMGIGGLGLGLTILAILGFLTSVIIDLIVKQRKST